MLIFLLVILFVKSNGIFDLHENFQKTLQILMTTFYFVNDYIKKKINNQKIINYQHIEKLIILIVTKIY